MDAEPEQLAIGAFAAAWNSQLVECAAPFTMRSEFRRVRRVGVLAALRSSLPTAQRWLAGGRQDDRRAGHGDLGTGAAVERLATHMLAGLDDRTRGHMAGLAGWVGTRRLSDASMWLAEVGAPDAAENAGLQARLFGSVQYGLVAGETQTAAATLQQLAAIYYALRAAVATACGT
ncbi:hypothetical protein ACFV2N_33260 [Streptomyces sp. NPDC059680]|uniref:hypothetical protein n=1 Tax=Streptomyces sp. NPDC059680 TaxID=3346904 RepID=UPI003697AA53